jgi:ribosome-associated protein
LYQKESEESAMTPKELAMIAVKALDEKKGREIAAIQVTEQTTLADYFVIATGSSNTQINALCGAVEKAMKEQAGEDPMRREGYRDGTWVLLDYGCVIVHVFSPEAREFYSLERLWSDGTPVDLTGVLTAD